MVLLFMSSILLSRATESDCFLENFCGLKAVRKFRRPKKYRQSELDNKLREQRTKVEATLLHKAKVAGVNTPILLRVSRYELLMSFADGRQLSKQKSISNSTAKQLAQIASSLHSHNIVHGDFTPANFLIDKNARGNLTLFDFGLGFISQDDESKATDLLLMKKSLPQPAAKTFLSSYKNKKIIRKMEEIEKRGRYVSERQ
ncbi:putative bifunctional tRNA threonylcarbamoyladenosine biosynthesis protein [Candidatus Gugararchaeum adminiculabundum]|nr:putative bifunctional tRNA threonylcarbamoyladenosine biosynthesis protein [Candidatus Gugararchaeum adminiculabundum]